MKRINLSIMMLLLIIASCTTIEIDEEDVFDVKRTIDPTYFQNTAYEVKEVSFLSENNLDLEGWFIRHPSSRGTVIFYGGTGFLMETAHWIIRAIVRNQVNLFVFNYRGYGKNPGKPSIAGLKSDGIAAFDYAVDSLGIKPSQIILHGHSLGTIVGSYVAARKEVAALIMESPVSEVSYYTDKMLPKFLKPFIQFNVDSNLLLVSNTDQLSNLSVPLLIIVGREDPITPPAMARNLYDKAPMHEKILEILDGGGHNNLPERKDYQNIIGLFYQNSLKQNFTKNAKSTAN